MKEIPKLTNSLTEALEQKVELEAKIGETWQELRMYRLAAIRGGNDPGPLPFFVGLEPQWREAQERQEGLARDNRAIDRAASAQGLVA
jgi:hypothetical protein